MSQQHGAEQSSQVTMKCQEVLDALDKYISNDIPINLIHLPEMKLLDREEVKSHYRKKLSGLSDSELAELASRSDRDAPGKDVSSRPSSPIESDWNAVDEMKKIVKFAIFSHRWLPAGEPSFQNMSSGKEGPGMEKLHKFCEKAADYDCEFAWSDTCCIDKRSSAELDESIRSMFKWYRNAYICIAYLADSFSIQDMDNDVWFTRGWTLQELLAPQRMKFFGKGWLPLSADRYDKHPDHWFLEPSSDSLDRISSITNIPIRQLLYFQPGLQDFAEKMGWASRRNTTRIEDVAYSLIGILDVSLPIAYGEGDRAFYRLMRAVIQDSSSVNIFRWGGEPSPYCAGLPISPSCYPGNISLLEVSPRGAHTGDDSFFIANGSLRINVVLIPLEEKSKRREGTSMVFTFTDPEGLIDDVTACVPNPQDNDRHSEQVAVGILNYLKYTGTGDTFIPGDSTLIAFLLRLSWEEVWEKVTTDGVIYITSKGGMKEIKKETTTLRLGRV